MSLMFWRVLPLFFALMNSHSEGMRAPPIGALADYVDALLFCEVLESAGQCNRIKNRSVGGKRVGAGSSLAPEC